MGKVRVGKERMVFADEGGMGMYACSEAQRGNANAVWVLSFESEGSGGFDWFLEKEDAVKAFKQERINEREFKDEGYKFWAWVCWLPTRVWGLDTMERSKEIDRLVDEEYRRRLEGGCFPYPAKDGA